MIISIGLVGIAPFKNSCCHLRLLGFGCFDNDFVERIHVDNAERTEMVTTDRRYMDNTVDSRTGAVQASPAVVSVHTRPLC